MSNKIMRSRILEHLGDRGLLEDLYAVCKSNNINDNNIKVDMVLNVLKQYNKDFVELGPGTNRLAILIDNYVFKIALDKWGLQDNINEFTMTQELQPYVVKTYETNDLISVCEYVTVISREEFEEQTDQIRRILAILAEGYLLGDVGTVPKNFCNWGYRDNGELVILDFAYIYRVRGDELLCNSCSELLQYDENFYNLKCPKCGRKYTFIDVRRKITMEDEQKENFMARELSRKLIKPIQEFIESDSSPSLNKSNKEEIPMKDLKKYTHEIEEDQENEQSENDYLEALKKLDCLKNKGNDIVNSDVIETPVIHQAPIVDTDEVKVLANMYAEEAEESRDNNYPTTDANVQEMVIVDVTNIKMNNGEVVDVTGDRTVYVETPDDEIDDEHVESTDCNSVDNEQSEYPKATLRVYLAGREDNKPVDCDQIPPQDKDHEVPVVNVEITGDSNEANCLVQGNNTTTNIDMMKAILAKDIESCATSEYIDNDVDDKYSKFEEETDKLIIEDRKNRRGGSSRWD